MVVRGIVLAGGTGSRLSPVTCCISKQLLPIYDKPMIYYPLSTLMLAGIRDILIISTPNDLPLIKRLLGDGSKFSIRLSYAVQPSPDGLAQAFIIGKNYLKGADKTALILGDNLLHGSGLHQVLTQAIQGNSGATIFSYHVNNPKDYGVVEFDSDGSVISIEEKPSMPRSNFAAVGLYIYDNKVVEKAEKVRPSARGELEITDLNRMYLEDNALKTVALGRGYFWIDAGTTDSLLEASTFVKMTQSRMRYMIGCPEEVAYRAAWLTTDDLLEISRRNGSPNKYYTYLHDLALSKA